MKTTATQVVMSWESLEPFQFTDGIRLAWIRWERAFPFGERTCVAVREVDTHGPRAEVRS